MTVTLLETTPTSQELETPDKNAGIHPFLVDLMGKISMTHTFASDRGILYSFRDERNLIPHAGDGAIKALEYEVLIKTETVTLRTITRTTGINQKSGKVYKSWKTDRSLSLSLKSERHGHRVLRIYEHITRTKKYPGSFTNATANYLTHFSGMEEPDADIFDVDYLLKGRHASLNQKAFLLASWAIHKLLQELDPTHPALKSKNTLAAAAYPAFQLFPNSNFDVKAIRSALPKNFSLHTEPDVKKFITKIFGPDGIRKDMIKAVVNTGDINSLFLAANLKHLYPLDWLRDLVKDPNSHYIFRHSFSNSAEQNEGLIALLSAFTLPQRKRLLVEKKDNRRWNSHHYDMTINDSVRMFSRLNETQLVEYRDRIDCTSWDQLHDTLSQINSEIMGKQERIRGTYRFKWNDPHPQHEDNYMKKLNETAYTLDGETYTIFAPQSKNVLREWGNIMHNCIGSYGYDVESFLTNVFGVYHEGELFGNIEIRNNGTIAQFMKKYNSPAPEEHFAALEAHIKETNKKEAERKRIERIFNERTATTQWNLENVVGA